MSESLAGSVQPDVEAEPILREDWEDVRIEAEARRFERIPVSEGERLICE